MKKDILTALCAALIVIALVFCLNGCNAQLLDTTFAFDKAIIKMPDGTVITGNVESWKDYEDGSDAIQVKMDGVTYTHFLEMLF